MNPDGAGSLAGEAARLFETLQQAAASWSRGPSGAGQEGGASCSCDHETPQTCRICPVCQLLSRLETVRPEAVQHLAEAASAVVAALSELATSRPPSARGPASPAGPARDDVQHIDISD